VHFLLLRHVLDDGFDDDVAVGKILALGRAFEPGERVGFLLLGDAALVWWALGKLAQRLLNTGKALVEILLFDFEDGGVESGHGTDLRDARAHQPTTKYANFL